MGKFLRLQEYEGVEGQQGKGKEGVGGDGGSHLRVPARGDLKREVCA